MKLLNKIKAETTYDIQLTEAELGAIIIALWNIDFDELKSCAKDHDMPIKIIENEDKFCELVNNLDELLP